MTKIHNTPERDYDGNLPAYAWPGGYPIFYLVEDGGVLCPNCANTVPEVKQAERDPDSDPNWVKQWRIVAGDVNWEDEDLSCDHCYQKIEAAYRE